MRGADPEKKRKRRKRFRVFMEIVFMVLGILCSVMPYPFPLAVPIGIGAIRIISKAVEKEKEPQATQPIVYCNGEREPEKNSTKNSVKTAKVQHSKGPTTKEQLAKATKTEQKSLVSGQTATQVKRELRSKKV